MTPFRSRIPDDNADKIDRLVSSVTVLETADYMKEAARQKSILAADGNLIEDFDIIIGSAAMANNLILVTGNA